MIVIVCVITNPDREVHATEIKELLYSEMNLSNNLTNDSNGFEALGLSLGMSMAEKLIEGIISVDNYVLFSTTNVNVNGNSRLIGYGLLGNVFIFDFVKEDFRTSNRSSKSKLLSSIDEVKDELKRGIEQKTYEIEKLDGVQEVILWGRSYSTKKKRLRLVNRGLSGEIPSQICKLENLEHLELADNNLYGYIPDCLCELINNNNLDINLIQKGNDLMTTTTCLD